MNDYEEWMHEESMNEEIEWETDNEERTYETLSETNDEESSKIMDKILDLTFVEEYLEKLGYKRKYVPDYYIQYPLKKEDKKKLLKILYGIINSIHSFLWKTGLSPEKYPTYYLPKKSIPKGYRMPYVYRNYFMRHILPFYIKQGVKYSENEQLSKEEHIQYRKFVNENMPYLVSLQTLTLERKIEDGEIPIELIEAIIRSDLRKRGATSKAIEDEMLRSSLTKKWSGMSCQKVVRYSLLAHEKIKQERQKKIEEDRKRIMEWKKKQKTLKSGKSYKELKKESTVEELVKKLSSKRRRGK